MMTNSCHSKSLAVVKASTLATETEDANGPFLKTDELSFLRHLECCGSALVPVSPSRMHIKGHRCCGLGPKQVWFWTAKLPEF